MKLNTIISVFSAAALLAFAACSEIDKAALESGGSLLTETQVQETNVASPSMGSAAFNGLFTYLGKPNNPYGGTLQPDCFSFIMITFCDDLEGADAWIADNDYNWFSVCGELSSRNANYRNPLVRYKSPYDMIGLCNRFITGYPEDVTDPESVYMIAQAKALRAFAYQRLAIMFSFGPTVTPDALCVPLVTPNTTDYANNPRVTTTQIYNFILEDLDWAVAHLDGYKRPDKSRINKAAALALRARAHLALGNWEDAYNDATDAIALCTADGIVPKTAAEILTSLKDGTAFESIDEKDWIWGYDMVQTVSAVSERTLYATSSSWLRSFSAFSYSAAVQTTVCVNTLLYDKIPDTDVRKNWWIVKDGDGNLQSPLLADCSWTIGSVTYKGNDIINASDGNSKMPFPEYTNVKFGCNPIGTTVNDEDFPFIRVDELYLMQAEALAHSDAAGAATILSDYVTTYRDPAYNVNAHGLSIFDEIWFQRRVELWGEGFFTFDMKRLGKNLVRFHDSGNKGNQPDAFAFNLPSNDPWLNMRFPQDELDTNHGIIDNTGGEQPKMGQNPNLRDGVTD